MQTNKNETSQESVMTQQQQQQRRTADFQYSHILFVDCLVIIACKRDAKSAFSTIDQKI